MSRRRRTRLNRLVPLLLAALLTLSILPTSGSAAGQKTRPGGIIPNRYIVTYQTGVTATAKTDALAQPAALGSIVVRHFYNSALQGFAADLTDAQVAALQADPDVASVTPDYLVSADAENLPTGVRRSEANRNSLTQIGSHLNPVDIDVAIIDTGIDSDHPDLNVVGGVNCVPNETSYDDENGHGTHVAGTVGALDNGVGVVGVAPGARLWAVRVLDADGQGDFADVICGVDWVTAHADTIDVANLSLGGAAPEGDCNDGSLHEAICDSIAAGVTYVVAAGNEGQDAALDVPAAYDEVITVSAIVDSDGLPGGHGSTSVFYGNDDTLALFSNFGPDVDIAAPGYGIYSTWLNGGYQYESGTSMASPHVAGAAALYLMANPGASPAEVKAGLLALAWPQNSPNGFSGDPDSDHEPLLSVGSIGGPPVQPACSINPPSVAAGANATVSCVYFGSQEFVKIYIDSASTTQRALLLAGPTGSGSATIFIPDLPAGPHSLIFVGSNSGYQVTLPLNIAPAMKLTGATSGKVGGLAMFQLHGYGASEPVLLQWIVPGNAPVTIATATTTATGALTSFLTIPEASAGAYTIQAVGTVSGASGSATYTVIPSLALTIPMGKPSQTTSATLRGYAPGETIEVRWYSSPTSYTVVGSAVASVLGSASVPFSVPAGVNGVHAVEGAGATGNLATANFTVQANLAMTPASGPAGTLITITLSGYKAMDSVAVRWYDTATTMTQVASVTTGPDGSAQVSFLAPQGVNGLHKVDVLSAGAVSGYTNFLTTAGMSILPSSGSAGTSVAVTFNGFKAGETVSLRWYPNAYTAVTVGSMVASATGGGTLTFVVPAATSGVHKVEVLGASSGARASQNFTVN